MNIKNTILKESFKTFYKNGFHNSGVELLAKQAGTTKRTLYAHFGNKDGLIEEVLNYRHIMFMNNLNESFETTTAEDLTSVRQNYFRFLRDWIESDDFYGCMFINACAEFSDPQSLPHVISKKHKIAVREFLYKKFEDVGEENPRQEADMLFLLGEGMIVSAQTEQDNLNLNLELLTKVEVD